MSITSKRLAEIKAFKDTDFSDCPELTEEQLAQLRPSHLRKAPITARPVIETNLAAAEKAIIAEGRKQYREHPETFVHLSNIR
jgi:hypothetical protein